MESKALMCVLATHKTFLNGGSIYIIEKGVVNVVTTFQHWSLSVKGMRALIIDKLNLVWLT